MQDLLSVQLWVPLLYYSVCVHLSIMKTLVVNTELLWSEFFDTSKVLLILVFYFIPQFVFKHICVWMSVLRSMPNHTPLKKGVHVIVVLELDTSTLFIALRMVRNWFKND